MKVLVTGATGFIGSRVVAELKSHGHSVIGASRVAERRFDLRRVDPDVCAGVDALVHCAYVANIEGPNTAGTALLLESAKRHRVSTRVFISSLAAASPDSSRYAHQKFVCEAMFDGGVCLRPGLVIGHGGLFGRMLAVAQKYRVVPMIDGGRQEVHTVWVGDVATAVVNALSAPSGRYAVAHPETARYRELWDVVASVLGLRLRMVSLPSRLLLAPLHAAQLLRLPLPITTDNVHGLRALKRTDTAGDAAYLGLDLLDVRESISRLTV